MKNGAVILFAVLGIAGLYYLFSHKSEKQDDTYQDSNVPLPAASTRSYSDIISDKVKRAYERQEAGEIVMIQ